MFPVSFLLREAFVMGGYGCLEKRCFGVQPFVCNFTCPTSLEAAQEQEECTVCDCREGATKIWAVHGAVILQRVHVALVSAASCRGNNDVGSP